MIFGKKCLDKGLSIECLNKDGQVISKKMMGEYCLYCNGTLFGGIYDDRLLLKPTEKAKEIIQDAEYSIPYESAKPMILCDFIDDGERLSNVIKRILSKNE